MTRTPWPCQRWLLQASAIAFGMLVAAAVPAAAGLDLTPAYCQAVASFYDMFHLQPVGRHMVEICTNLSCALVGAQRVVEAFECGAVLNPDQLKNQIEGAIVQGIGGALFEQLDFDNGKIVNPRFSRYRVPRFSDVPVIETVLVDRKDLPSAGAGETPIVGLAPAVSNAIFDGIGVRLRSLPMAPNGVKG